MKNFGKLLLVSALMLGLPIFAHAHPGHEGHDLTWSFTSGFAHPFTGWDHLLAMIAVGIWAARLGGRARWLVPAAFVGTMMIGALGGHAGMALPGIEQGIAASLFTLGLLIAFTVRLPIAASTGVAALFAIFHGWAHGAEMPATGGAFSYGAGFVMATTLLHAAGLGFSTLLHTQPKAVRLAGGIVAAAGVLAYVA